MKGWAVCIDYMLVQFWLGGLTLRVFFSVYLISLDKFVEDLALKQQQIKSSVYKSRFFKVEQQKLNRKNLFEKTKVDNIRLFNSVHKAFSVYYIRYNWNFLIGLCFEKKIARAIVNEIQAFTKSDLHLKCSNYSISCGYSKSFYFIGFYLKGSFLSMNKKSQHLIRLNKIKASLQRKKIVESNRYFKLVARMSSKMHKWFLSSVWCGVRCVVKFLFVYLIIHCVRFYLV